MGSASDWETLEHAAGTLEDLGVPMETRIVSAHRTPHLLVDYASSAEDRGLELPDDDRDALAVSLPAWPVFPDVPPGLTELRARGWKLAILSNTDADLLDASLLAIGVPVDLRIVASEIGSYKPGFGHWESFFRETGADRVRHVHVAASLFHDVEPCAKLGLPCVWINRQDETSELPRAGELTDLSTLADTLDRLVPA